MSKGGLRLVGFLWGSFAAVAAVAWLTVHVSVWFFMGALVIGTTGLAYHLGSMDDAA